MRCPATKRRTEAAPIALALWLAACGAVDETGPPAAVDEEGGIRAGDPLFVERAAELGIDFVHHNGMSGELYLAEITCGGAALADLDGDGDLDAYLLQGHLLGPGKTYADVTFAPRHPLPLGDRLYLNRLAETGTPGFDDATGALGVAATGYGCAVAAGDVDNDGDVDLYVANLGPDQLLRNRGGAPGGLFDDATAAAGLGDAGSGTAPVFFDFDRDGWLDLFLGRNVTFDHDDPEGAVTCRSLSGARDYCGPGAYPAQPDRLYRNRRDGTFEDVTAAMGLAVAPARPTLGAVAADLDGDGWLDLYVANDGEPNNLWLNQAGRGFRDEALLAGCALDAGGAAEASMGVDAGDVDGDGDDDLFLTHLVKETNTLYRNDGGGRFRDRTAASGLGPPSLPYTSFGTRFVDFDNDGWLDLFAVSGAVTILPELAAAGDPFPLHQRNQLFRNLGPGERGDPRFEDVSDRAGDAFELSEVSRGAALGDVDEDGDVDVLVANNGGPARLLLNRAGDGRPWLGIRALVGEPARDALGARAALLRRGRSPLWRRLGSDGSYASASDPRVVFGLGGDPAVEAVVVVWPDGAAERFDDLEPGRYHDLRRGRGRPFD